MAAPRVYLLTEFKLRAQAALRLTEPTPQTTIALSAKRKSRSGFQLIMASLSALIVPVHTEDLEFKLVLSDL